MAAKKKVTGKAVVDEAKARAPRAGAPPGGTVGEDAVDRLVNQWLRHPKLPADYIRLPRALLVQDAEELLGGREDLDAFREHATPIKASAFDYLDVLVRKARALPAERRKAEKPLPESARVTAALDGVGRALGAVLRRAEANVRGVRTHELSARPATPALFIAQLLHVVQGGRRRADRWDDPEHALKLFRALEGATLELESAWKLNVTGAPPTDAALNAMALDRLLFDAVTYLAAYGRAVFPPDDPRHARYTLRALFPSRPASGLQAPIKLVR